MCTSRLNSIAMYPTGAVITWHHWLMAKRSLQVGGHQFEFDLKGDGFCQVYLTNTQHLNEYLLLWWQWPHVYDQQESSSWKTSVGVWPDGCGGFCQVYLTKDTIYEWISICLSTLIYGVKWSGAQLCSDHMMKPVHRTTITTKEEEQQQNNFFFVFFF